MNDWRDGVASAISDAVDRDFGAAGPASRRERRSKLRSDAPPFAAVIIRRASKLRIGRASKRHVAADTSLYRAGRCWSAAWCCSRPSLRPSTFIRSHAICRASRRLQNYQPPVTTRVYAEQRHAAGRICPRERRIFVPIAFVPKLVINAFTSAEDKNFYSHPGIDPSGIARAAVKDVFNRPRA
jgi:hypothetical protein